MSNLRTIEGEVKRIVMYVDGCIVKIQRPDHAGNAYFCGRRGKSCDSLNIQYVVDKNGLIRHIVTGASGASHDRTVLSWSQEFMNCLNLLPEDCVALADPAYSNLHPKIVTSFVGENLTAEQLEFNVR